MKRQYVRLCRLSLAVACGLGCAAISEAQAKIAYLGGDQIDAIHARRDRIQHELEIRGHQLGRDFVIVATTFDGDKSQLPVLASQVARDGATIIYAGSWDVANEMKRHTAAIPIIFAARANLDSPQFRIVSELPICPLKSRLALQAGRPYYCRVQRPGAPPAPSLPCLRSPSLKRAAIFPAR